ncbi:MAG: ABC transporter ATP-binding protein [Lachnospiraceae bacterium]|nr:ABC transporter ATP-binding protein [Lachnospiraceae bacterium]
MIQCSGITKSFTDKKVLSGISFDIPDGQIFGLLGPSGAGKTTLIKILTGQLSFDDGSAMILQRNVRHLSGEDRKKIGIMMDQFGVYERLSCYDNLKIYAEIYGVPKERIMETLKLVGLEDSAKKPASSLSKGMLVRLQLARVFMISPDVIFLDEPTTGLDPVTQKQIHRIIMDKKKHGCTIFLTTHNMEEAAKLCDTVALLNEGVIVDRGAPEEICRRFNHQKKIVLHLKTGEDVELPHSKESADKIRELMEKESIETIHSSEPTLETVFLELTGRKLEEED